MFSHRYELWILYFLHLVPGKAILTRFETGLHWNCTNKEQILDSLKNWINQQIGQCCSAENGGLVRSWINCWEKEYSRLYFWGQKMDTVTLTPADPGWLDITHKIPPRAIWLNYHTSNIVHLEINNDVLIDIVDWMDGTENRARLKVSRALNMKKKKLRI